jgi:DNA/RNA endonuclease YhcR with UshA esterase domain
VPDKMLYPALVVSIIGLLLIAFISPSLKPPSSSISDLSQSALQKAVLIHGNVTKSHDFKGGSKVLTVSDGSSTIDVFLPYAVASEFKGVTLIGQEVEALGVVQLYSGRKEVVVERAGDLRLA